MLLDVTPQRAVCEWWHLDTAATPSTVETFAIGYQTLSGSNRLQPTALNSPLAPAANPPALAP